MGLYAKIVSVKKEIEDIKVKVENNTKDIVHVWATVDGIQKMLWPDNVVNLVGATKYEADIVWPAGRYSVDVQAGGTSSNSSATNIEPGRSGRIVTNIDVSEPFIVRAYCGSAGSAALGGINPYSGVFKVGASDTYGAISAVNHIFGNRGSTTRVSGASQITIANFSSGNCLGNGVAYGVGGIGAGSCLHFLPVGGTFGTDYLAAFHTTSAVCRIINQNRAPGVGSAYGGAGSGAVRNSAGSGSPSGSVSSYAGGSTPYGNGGAGVTVPQGAGITVLGNNGTGPGYGYGGGVSTNGAGAWFNGTEWVDSRSVADAVGEDGHIIVKYLGPIE